MLKIDKSFVDGHRRLRAAAGARRGHRPDRPDARARGHRRGDRERGPAGPADLDGLPVRPGLPAGHADGGAPRRRRSPGPGLAWCPAFRARSPSPGPAMPTRYRADADQGEVPMPDQRSSPRPTGLTSRSSPRRRCCPAGRSSSSMTRSAPSSSRGRRSTFRGSTCGSWTTARSSPAAGACCWRGTRRPRACPPGMTTR